METWIYEKDYADGSPRQPIKEETDEILKALAASPIFQQLKKQQNEVLAQIPKIVVPEDKENFEILLSLCENYAKQHCGAVKGVIDCKTWGANIYVTKQHFFEFENEENLRFLQELSARADAVTFKIEPDGTMCLDVFICYFEDGTTPDGKTVEDLNEESMELFCEVLSSLPLDKIKTKKDFVQTLLDELAQEGGPHMEGH